jgi:hypothetical protein
LVETKRELRILERSIYNAFQAQKGRSITMTYNGWRLNGAYVCESRKELQDMPKGLLAPPPTSGGPQYPSFGASRGGCERLQNIATP